MPNPSRPVAPLNYFCGVFENKIGKHKLLYAAEIDGVQSKEALEEPVDWSKIRFVELKASVSTKYSPAKKFLEWWSQSCLVPIDRIVCALHTEGKVFRFGHFKLKDLPRIANQAQVRKSN